MGRMFGKIGVYFCMGLFVISLGGMAFAQHGQGHGGMAMSGHGSDSHSMSTPMSMKDRPVQSVTVEGMKISLELMDMSMHTSMQAKEGNPIPGGYDHSQSHAIMVMIQDTASKEIITDAKVTCTVVRPSGERETGSLMWSGGHYGKGFTPTEKGSYEVQLKIESGGTEREANFPYNL